MYTTEISICLSLPQDLKEYAVEIARSTCTDDEFLFLNDNKTRFMHIGLYPVDVPVQYVEQIMGTLKNIARETQPFKCNFSELIAYEGYISIFLKNDKYLQSLRNTVIQQVNPVRQGYVRKKFVDGINCRLEESNGIYKLVDIKHSENIEKKYTGLEEENIRKFGYPRLNKSIYDPHISLVAFKDKNLAQDRVKKIQWKYDMFECTGFTINRSDDGLVYYELEDISFSEV